jgi:two-component system chemotaxis sensor kinase CheA
LDSKEKQSSEKPAKTSPSIGAAIKSDGPATLSEGVDAELIKDFVAESLDDIEKLEAILRAVEDNPDAPQAIDAVFRAFHTINGASGFLGLDRIQKLAQLAENLVSRAKTGELPMTEHFAHLCLNACDTLRTMIGGVRGVEPGAPLPVPDDLQELLARLSNPEAVETNPPGEGA